MDEKPTILIAEDDTSNYLYFEALLHYSYNLLWAKDGGQAVEMALENDVDIVLMDFKMPVMTGLEATRRIKQAKPEMKVVIQTAYALEEHRQNALYAGADYFITKPVSSNTLIEVVEKMLKVGSNN